MGNIGRHNTPSASCFDRQKPQVARARKQAENRLGWAHELEAEASHCINPEVAAAFRKAAAQLRAEFGRASITPHRKVS